MNKQKLALLLPLILLVAALIPAVVKAGANISFSPTDDSYVSTYHEDDPGTNFGTATFLRVSNYGADIMYVFLMFDLSTIPTGSTIVSADLKLYAQYGLGDFNIEAYRVVLDWDETTITWNNMPSIASSYTYLCGAPTTNSWASFDVKSDVQLFVSGSADNYGWCLKIDESAYGYYGSRLFDSKEYSDPNTWPVLEVTYGPGLVVPVIPLGTLAAAFSMIGVLACYIGLRWHKIEHT